jgi:PatG Domain
MQQETQEQSISQDEAKRDIKVITPSQGDVVGAPPTSEVPCPTCAGPTASMPASHVYTIGRIEARFPRLSVEKEFAQATGRAETAGQTDQETFYQVLSKPENRYLARQLCWVFMIQGLETYIVHPRDPRDFDRLVEAIRPQPSPMDIDVVIGMRGPIAPPEVCNGLMVPMIVFDQVYSFDRDALIKAIPRPEKMTEKQFEAAAGEVFDRILQMTDNAGATDEHRAAELLGHALSRYLRQGGGRICTRLFANRGRCASFTLERHAQDRRCHLPLHRPQDRFHREVLRAGGCD